jgi:phosphate acyltransferase
MPRRVAVDPGSCRPDAVAAAVVRAVAEDPALEVVLVGGVDPRHPRVSTLAAGPPADPPTPPEIAVRGRADLPVRVAIDALATGAVDAVVSAAAAETLLTAARFVLRRQVGVRHPLLAVRVDVDGRARWLVDASGRAGATAAAIGLGVAELAPHRTAVLVVGADATTAERERLEHLAAAGVPVAPVPIGDWLDADADVLVTGGATGAAIVATARTLAPGVIGAGRVLGLEAASVWHAESADGILAALLMAARP